MSFGAVQGLIDHLLAIEDALSEMVKRVRHLLYLGDLSQLTELPLSPEEMVQAGTVLLRAPANGRYAAARTAPTEPCPVLAPPLRRRLRALVDEAGPHADAALFILIQDLKARALNDVLALSS